MLLFTGYRAKRPHWYYRASSGSDRLHSKPGSNLAPVSMVAVRAEVVVFALQLQVMVPELVPLAPDVIESQSPPDVTSAYQDMVVPVTVKYDCPACVTATSTGLLVAPSAVTLTVAVRGEVLVFAGKLQVMVPESVPLAPDVIVSQLLSGAALHGIVPVPVLETPNVVVPDVLLTFWFEGVTERYGVVLPIAKSCLISSSESARL
jgi:hypothetical protein